MTRWPLRLAGAGHFERGRVLQTAARGSIVPGHGDASATAAVLTRVDSGGAPRVPDREALERGTHAASDAREDSFYDGGGGDPLPGSRAFSPGLELDDDRGWSSSPKAAPELRWRRSDAVSSAANAAGNGECSRQVGAGDHQRADVRGGSSESHFVNDCV